MKGTYLKYGKSKVGPFADRFYRCIIDKIALKSTYKIVASYGAGAEIVNNIRYIHREFSKR